MIHRFGGNCKIWPHASNSNVKMVQKMPMKCEGAIKTSSSRASKQAPTWHTCTTISKSLGPQSKFFFVQHPPRGDYRTNQSGSLIYGCTANTWLGDKTICDYYISYNYITWGATRDTDNSMSSPVCPKNGRWVKLREIWVLSFTWCQGYGYYGLVLLWRDVIYIQSPRLSLPFSKI